MDPRQLFFDQRLMSFCVYCGNKPSTRDHVPSKVLLDEPYPSDLPVVPACETCNKNFSKDEQYVACLIECVLLGSVEPAALQRTKIKRILQENPGLATRLEKSRVLDASGNKSWQVEVDRVKNIALKLARGHVAYEFSEPQLSEPNYIFVVPLLTMAEDELDFFESPFSSIVWPEIGSRAFIRSTKNSLNEIIQKWQIVQAKRYRYMVNQSDKTTVRIILSEYLACEINWG